MKIPWADETSVGKNKEVQADDDDPVKVLASAGKIPEEKVRFIWEQAKAAAQARADVEIDRLKMEERGQNRHADKWNRYCIVLGKGIRTRDAEIQSLQSKLATALEALEYVSRNGANFTERLDVVADEAIARIKGDEK